MSFKIVKDGQFARLHGDVSTSLERNLQSVFMRVNVEDFSDNTQFYSDGVLKIGTAGPLCSYLQSLGYQVAIDMPVISERRYNWNVTVPARHELQTTMIDELCEARYKETTGIYVAGQAPPGVGKTFMAASIVAKLGRKTTILVPNESPFTQAINAFARFTDLGDDVGYFGAGKKKIGNCVIMIKNSLHNALKKDPNGAMAQHFINSEVVLIDEAHRAAADSWVECFEYLKNPDWVISLSATFRRDDDTQETLTYTFGEIIHRITRAEAVSANLSVPLSIYMEKIPERTFDVSSPSSSYTEFYEHAIANNKYRNEAAVSFIKQARDDGFTGAYSVKLIEKHINQFSKLDKECVAVSAKDKNREEVFDRLNNQEISAVASTLIDEAVDIPSLTAMAMVAGGKSSIKAEQRIRNDRIFEGTTSRGYYKKTRAHIWIPYDDTNPFNKHSEENKRILKAVCKEHPLHEFIEI